MLSTLDNDDDNCKESLFNSLRPRQNRRHFADDIFECIFLNENVWIAIMISLKFVSKGPINNITALVSLLTHTLGRNQLTHCDQMMA